LNGRRRGLNHFREDDEEHSNISLFSKKLHFKKRREKKVVVLWDEVSFWVSSSDTPIPSLVRLPLKDLAGLSQAAHSLDLFLLECFSIPPFFLVSATTLRLCLESNFAIEGIHHFRSKIENLEFPIKT